MKFIDPSHIPATGNQEIDRDHRELAETMNRIYDAWQQGERGEGLAHHFQSLRQGLVSHFAKETTIARGAGYDRWLAHHQEHKDFLGKFDAFLAEFQAQPTGEDPNIEMFMELEKHLFEHEVLSDQEMWGLWKTDHPAASSGRLIDWRPEHTVGVEQIDGQHQRLIGLLNDIHVKLSSAAPPVTALLEQLRSLTQEAVQHFHSEEQYFSQLPNQLAEQHRLSHEGLVRELKRAIDDNDPPNLEGLRALVGGYLKFWLLDHIVNTDSRLREYLG
jgi:hemerythrin-like metal-binding protein